MKKIVEISRFLIILGFFLAFVLPVKAFTGEYEELFAWVAKQKICVVGGIYSTQIQINSASSLASVIVCTPLKIKEVLLDTLKEELGEKLSTIWGADWAHIQEALSKDTEQWEELCRGGFYSWKRNKIYITEDIPLDVLVHEITHYFQIQYTPRGKYFVARLKRATKQDSEEVQRRHQELEEEAERIQELWRREMIYKVEIVQTKAP